MNYYSRFTSEEIDSAIGALLSGKAALITNCPNCGAPIENAECQYCGTKFTKCEKRDSETIGAGANCATYGSGGGNTDCGGGGGGTGGNVPTYLR